MRKDRKSDFPANLWDAFGSSNYVELLGTICLTVTYCLIMQSQNSTFLSVANMKNVSEQIVVHGILSCALVSPMIGGTFGLSNGAIAGLGGVIRTRLITDSLLGLQLSLMSAVLLTVVVCCVFGTVNGFIVSKTRIPSFIVILGADIYLREILYAFASNTSMARLPKTSTDINNKKVGGIPLSTLVIVFIFVVSFLALTGTSFGRKIHAAGGNYQAAYLSGINIKAVRPIVYMMCAGPSAIAGVLMASRVGAATPSVGDGYSTITIAVYVMGRVSLDGGSGTIIGVFLDAVTMGVIANRTNLLHINSNWQMIIRGILMIVAVFYSMWMSQLAARTKRNK